MSNQNEDLNKKNRRVVCNELYSDEEFDKGINEGIGCYYESTDQEY